MTPALPASDVHIFTAPWQPATRFRVEGIGWIRWPASKRVRCHKCNRLRWAKNMEIQAFYDKTEQRCRGGCAQKARKP